MGRGKRVCRSADGPGKGECETLTEKCPGLEQSERAAGLGWVGQGRGAGAGVGVEEQANPRRIRVFAPKACKGISGGFFILRHLY